MGNVIEPSVDSIPNAHEEGSSPIATEASSGESGQSDFTREMPGLLASFASGQRLQTPIATDQGDIGSRPPSRVLIRGEDSSNVWIPLPDARVAQSPIEPTTNVSTDPSDTSFPLSESDLPETFDTSVDPAELSDFFVNPPAANLEIADEDRMVPLPTIEADPIKVAGSAHPVESSLKDSESDLSTSLSSSIVLPVSATGCQRRKSILSRDAPTFIPKQKVSTMSEPFSRLQSTVSDILSSHVPVYSTAMDQVYEAPTFRSADVLLPATSAKLERNVQTSQFHEVVYPAPRTEEPRCSAPRLPEDLPLAVTTYADATNLAMQYPEYADRILTLPLPKPLQASSQEGKEQATQWLPPVPNQEPVAEPLPPPLSPSLHHSDRPHWAAAALLEKSKAPEALPAPQSRDNSDTNHAVDNSSSSRSQRHGRNDSGSCIHAPHHDSPGSLTPQIDDSGRRRDPPPHPRGAEDLEYPPHLGVRLIRRLSISSNPSAIGSEGSDNDTGTLISRTHDRTWGIGHAKAIASNTPSAMASTERSDVGANHKVASDWDIPDVDQVGLGPNATHLPRDGWYQQAPSISGPDRLGRHIISPHTTISVNHESARSVSRRAHKQQVADLNIAARRYLGEGPNRRSRRASSSASSNRSVEITGIVDASQAASSTDKHLVDISEAGDSIAQRSPPPFKATAAEEQLTPMLRSGGSPFRELQLRTNNMAPVFHRSPKASADPQIVHSISCSTKLHVSPHITSLQSLEKHSAGHFSDPGSEWLAPPEHTVDDWLPPGSTNGPTPQNALSPSQILHFTNSLGALLPPKYMSNSGHPAQRVDVQHPFGLDLRTKDTSANWFREPAFTLPSAGNNGPTTGEQRRYPRRVRQSLPAQSEAFSQHLAEAHPSHSGNEGRRWKGRGRGARSVSSQNPQQRQHAYDFRYSFEAAPAPAINRWQAASP